MINKIGTPKKIIFAHLLRGIAAVIVIVAHYFGVFWGTHIGLAHRIGFDPLPNSYLIFNDAQIIIENKLLIGQFGVGVFFLISGFLVPISRKNKHMKQFFLSRIFRIYPVYIAGFTVCILSILFLDQTELGRNPYTIQEILTHYFIVIRQWIGYPKIDGISWTLEIELYFYIFIGLFWRFFENKPLATLITSSVIIGVMGGIFFQYGYTWYVGRQLLMIQFMMIGVAFYFHYIGQLSTKELILFSSLTLLLFSFMWQIGYFSHSKNYAAIIWINSYILSITLFTLAYLFKNKVRNNRFLSHLADLSYPLYAIHGVFGYTLIYLLMLKFQSPWVAIFCTIIIVYFLTSLIHYFVEKPTARYLKDKLKR